jgi:hypothetical protein
MYTTFFSCLNKTAGKPYWHQLKNLSTCWGIYYKIWICNAWKMEGFCSKLVFFNTNPDPIKTFWSKVDHFTVMGKIAYNNETVQLLKRENKYAPKQVSQDWLLDSSLFYKHLVEPGKSY